MRAFSDTEGRALSTPVYWEQEEKRWPEGLEADLGEITPRSQMTTVLFHGYQRNAAAWTSDKRGVFRKFMWKQYAELIEVVGLK